ncbi:MAG: protein phosphatase CheZ [Ferrovibrionaceae bacterium]
MTQPPTRKMFTAELKMLGLERAPAEDEAAAASVPAADPAAATTGDLGLVLAEIRALRAEVAALRAVQAAPAEEAPREISEIEEENQGFRVAIAGMIRSLARTKREIAALRHPEAEGSQIDTATNELDRIVAATETATNTILESAEQLGMIGSVLVDRYGDDADMQVLAEEMRIGAERIMEACSFQDITGQRITKVVKAIHFIEERIRAVVEEWGAETFIDLPVENRGEVRMHSQDDLVNGPDSNDTGLNQDDIDALFD